ncbi:pilus assembly protein TadG-related protein [Thermorudis peleae]|uniref:pilus assembly protein TadG-related protein n=1 Tax=Thermorudis peleae TaxID=1382356 RepID=UPI00056F21D0|nr:pilus assembly protein TadG-related protein [Thermorudis peleae]
MTHTTRRRRLPGQVLVLMAAALVALAGFSALALDVGMLLATKRSLQNAADAAALAGAIDLLKNQSDTIIQGDVTSYAQTNVPSAIRSSLQIPEITVDRTNKQVKVTVTAPPPRFFLGVVYSGPWSATARAAAQLTPITKPYALLALKQNDPQAINLIGNVGIRIVNGSAMSNGGMRCTGNGSLQADGTVDAVGNLATTGNCGFNGQAGTNTGMPIVPDPLANMPAPPKPTVPSAPNPPSGKCSSSAGSTTCPSGSYSTISQSGNGSLVFPGTVYQIQSVQYNGNGSVTFGSSGGGNFFYFTGGGLNISGNCNVTFYPGTYVFNNSNFTITGNCSITFMPGQYQFFIINGTLALTGNMNTTQINPAQMSFYIGGSNASFGITGNTDSTLPPGLYYIDGPTVQLVGNQTIRGQNVLFYLDNGSTISVVGNTSYQFTGSTTPLYPGMQPGLVIFQARGNSSTLRMVGNSSSQVNGIVYLPSAQLQLTGNASGTWATGQLIVNSLSTNGNVNAVVKYQEYVKIAIPTVSLVPYAAGTP